MATMHQIHTAIAIAERARVTPFIWGLHGLGKSSTVRQFCNMRLRGFIDLRCSQVEASDIRGLPSRGEDGRTHYLPPADLPIGDMNILEYANVLAGSVGMVADVIPIPTKATEEALIKLAEPLIRKAEERAKTSLDLQRRYDKAWTELQPRLDRGILFLDEPNRAQDDVLQAVFQLVLDRRVGQYSLPPGWTIVAAGNYMEGYQVNGFTDAAFLDRFSHVTLSGGEPTLEEWVNYMSDTHKESASDVIEFASQNLEHLDGKHSGELGFQITPSRRSWDAVVRVVKAAKEIKADAEGEHVLIAGLVGHEMAIAYQKYSCPVKPAALIRDGVKRWEKELKSLQRTQMNGLIWGLVSFCRGKADEEETGKVILDFAEFTLKHCEDHDLTVAFVRAMVSSSDGEKDGTRAALLSNAALATLIVKHRKQSGEYKPTLMDRLVERPALQDLLAKTAWGKE